MTLSEGKWRDFHVSIRDIGLWLTILPLALDFKGEPVGSPVQYFLAFLSIAGLAVLIYGTGGRFCRSLLT